MVGTKYRGYSNLGRLSEGEYSGGGVFLAPIPALVLTNIMIVFFR